MNQDLLPIPNLTVRIMTVSALSLLALIGTTHFVSKLVFVATMAFVFGTFRRFRISEKSLKHRWWVCFVPLKHQQWKLKKYSYIEAVIEPATGVIELLSFGILGFVYGWIIDQFFGWVGGTYQLWLNNSKDQRVLAWQGNSQADYQRNLEVIEELIGLRIQMR